MIHMCKLTLFVIYPFSFQNGLKALRKESREKLDAYQRLFYLLQVIILVIMRQECGTLGCMSRSVHRLLLSENGNPFFLSWLTPFLLN